MATPITHIVLADKVFDRNFSGIPKKDFLIGASFPDIRYLNVIDRRSTHFGGSSIKDIRSENDMFMAGVRFHALADEVREKYVIDHKLYDEMPKSRYITYSLKFFEDELLYENFKDWDGLIKEFKEIPYEKIGFDIEKRSIDKWYSLLTDYFMRKPVPDTQRKLIKGLGFSDEDAQGIEDLVIEIKNNSIIRDKTLDMYNNFALLLEGGI